MSLGTTVAGVLACGAMLLVHAPLASPTRHGAAAPPPAPGGHGAHGTPREWKFTWPPGDPTKGREAFVKLECYSCHEVKGETFPAPSEAGKVGPELSFMGPLHEPAYFAEAIINPSAVIEPGKGYEAPDGSSKMPSYNDSVTVQEIVDLVAYLTRLRPPAAAAPTDSGGHGDGATLTGGARLGRTGPARATGRLDKRRRPCCDTKPVGLSCARPHPSSRLGGER